MKIDSYTSSKKAAKSSIEVKKSPCVSAKLLSTAGKLLRTTAPLSLTAHDNSKTVASFTVTTLIAPLLTVFKPGEQLQVVFDSLEQHSNWCASRSNCWLPLVQTPFKTSNFSQIDFHLSQHCHNQLEVICHL